MNKKDNLCPDRLIATTNEEDVSDNRKNKDDEDSDNYKKQPFENNKYFIPQWILFLILIVLATCSKDEHFVTPNLKNSNFGNNEEIVCIGKIIEGIPYLDISLIPNIIEGIAHEDLTYKRNYPHGAKYTFDESSLHIQYDKPYSPVNYLIIRGTAHYSGTTSNFIVAYELLYQQNSLWNISSNQAVCSGSNCDKCSFLYSGVTIIGCDACPVQNGICNHLNSKFCNGDYLIIPVRL